MQPSGSETSTGTDASGMPLPQEEQGRANIYGLLARLLLAPPDDALLGSLAGADSIVSAASDQPLDRAWDQLSLAARLMPFDAVRDEFNELFVSTSVPKINPYGSLYMAGFLHEKPLAALRTDLAQLGLARRRGVPETEDHLGALCETMRRMIMGGQGLARQPVERQHEFFEVHIAPWSGVCLGHLRQAEGARFYPRVADLAEAFFDIERAAFEVAEDFADD
jgi:TorA maturation chaperone TorD